MPPRLRFPRWPGAGSRQCKIPSATTKRTLIAAPKSGAGPLMERRADRALPPLDSSRRWLRTIPIFAVVMGISMGAIFNYQKQSSSVVTSTMYALRTNPTARELLGDEVYFASQVPWIRGEMNQLHGRIDIRFWVKGTKQKALMRFKSVRKQRMGYVSVVHVARRFRLPPADRCCSSRHLNGVWRPRMASLYSCLIRRAQILSALRQLAQNRPLDD